MLMIFEVNLLASRNQVGGDWKRVSCKGRRFFIAVGAFPAELLAYQVSMVCAANWQDSSIYILDTILG